MTLITTRIIVKEDGSVSLATPLPVGEHVASIEVPDGPRRPFDVNDMPKWDPGPWPEGLRIDREWLYGDDGE